MNKQYLFIFLMVFLVVGVFAIEECQDQTDTEDVPCLLVTPYITCPPNNYNATVMDLNNHSRNYTVNMTTIGSDGTTAYYNFTFNYTNISQYYVSLCENTTATIDVGHWAEDYNDKWLYLYGFTLAGALGLFFFGVRRDDNLLTLLSGFLVLAFAITFVTNGYPGLNNQTINLSVILISLGIGLYLTGKSAINLVNI